MLKKVLVGLILVGFVFILKKVIALNGVTSIEQLCTNTVALENVNYIIQIIVGIFVVIGTFIAVWQYILASKDSKNNREREYQLHEKEIFEMEKDRVQRAIDLAGYYKDNILPNTMLIRHVYQEIGITEILNKIDFQKISHFDTYEMENCISVSDRNIIKQPLRGDKLIDALIMYSEVVKIWDDCKKEVNIVEEDGKKVRKVLVAQGAILYRFQEILNQILNNLEFFAMHFAHGTADDTVIYQSLHQSYIETVQLLYYDISANNTPGESKLYTNVVELYNKWVKEANKQKENETAVVRENIAKGRSLKTLDKN